MSNASQFTASKGTVTANGQSITVVNVVIPSNGFWNLDYYVNGALWGAPGYGYGWSAFTGATGMPLTTIANANGPPTVGPIFGIPLTFDKNGNVLTYASVAITLSYYSQPGGTLLSTQSVQLQ